MSSRRKDEEQTRRIKIVQGFALVGGLGNSLLKYGSISSVAYYAFRTIKELAGKNTFAELTFNSAINWIANDYMASALGLVFGFSGIYYGVREARLRKDAIERLSVYQERYERELDPKRSSSKLTTRGETRPEDLNE